MTTTALTPVVLKILDLVKNASLMHATPDMDKCMKSIALIVWVDEL